MTCDVLGPPALLRSRKLFARATWGSATTEAFASFEFAPPGCSLAAVPPAPRIGNAPISSLLDRQPSTLADPRGVFGVPGASRTRRHRLGGDAPDPPARTLGWSEGSNFSGRVTADLAHQSYSNMVRDLGIEPSHTGAQNRPPTLDDVSDGPSSWLRSNLSRSSGGRCH